MFTDEITREKVNKLIEAIKNKDIQKIEIAKYDVLCDCANLFDLVTNYIVLNKFGVNFNFGTSIIKKGTKLYRIRKFDSDTDFSNPSQWTAPPHKPQNRANRQGQEALYLGSTETICLLETHIQKGEKYALATYECTDDIKLGGFCLYKENSYHIMAGITLNAWLIAPSRNEINKELFEYLDSFYGDLQPDDIKDWKNNFDLPLQFAVLNKRNQYYETTNCITDILRKQTPCGIRYSSCYLPMETLGIVCSDFNVVLYKEGISKIKFLRADIKTNEQKLSDIDSIKIVCEISKKAKTKINS